MSGTVLLQIFLVVNVFLLGVLAAIAYQHFNTHIKPKNQHPENTEGTPKRADFELPEHYKQRLLEASEAQFEEVLNQSANEMQGGLKVTAGHINNLVVRLASEIVSEELERYRKELSQLHEKANSEMGGISAQIAQHQSEIEAKVTQEMEAEKQRLIKQIDTKLNDAVTSFLLETLQHNVDLGSQSTYLVAMLEQHKEEFKKEVGNEVQPAG
jgi:hypothetical protein